MKTRTILADWIVSDVKSETASISNIYTSKILASSIGNTALEGNEQIPQVAKTAKIQRFDPFSTKAEHLHQKSNETSMTPSKFDFHLYIIDCRARFPEK